jgi:hypothetical protein
VPPADSSASRAFVEALVDRDVSRAAGLLHPDVNFRAMTPNRIWEAGEPSDVEAILREWFEDPDEELHSVQAGANHSIEDVDRIGWLVHISDADGPHVFEQQAYVRERDSRIVWMRVICSGWIPLPPAG